MTKAVLVTTNPSILSIAAYIPAHKLLLWDKDGYINLHLCDKLRQYLRYTDYSGRVQIEEIDLEEIANACIFYRVAEKQSSRPGHGVFKQQDLAVNNLMQAISPDIANPREVAIEIILAWNRLAQRRTLTNSLVKAEARANLSISTCQNGANTIHQNSVFEIMIQGLLQTYILELASYEYVSEWVMHQIIELFASTIIGTEFAYKEANIYRSWFILNQQVEIINKTNSNLQLSNKLQELKKYFTLCHGEKLISAASDNQNRPENFPYFTLAAAEKFSKFTSFAELTTQLQQELDKYGIDINQTDILEHILIRMGNCQLMPTKSYIAVDPDNPLFFYIDCDLQSESLFEIANQINLLFDAELADYAVEFRHAEMQAIRFNINLFVQLVLPNAFPKFVNNILADENIKKLYQSAKHLSTGTMAGRLSVT